MEPNLDRRSLFFGLACLGFASHAQARESGVPYLPTPAALVEAMLDLAQLRADDFLIDLGSGDGRIAIAAGKRGARALGVEIDSNLVARASGYARGEGVADRVRFRRQDLFETPLREASVVTLYLLPEFNLRLRPRLLTEPEPGTRVVSHAFDMDDWRPDAARTVEGRRLYLWIVPAVAGGSWRLSMQDGTGHALEIEQRFQDVVGTLDGQPITATLRGANLRFTAGGKVFEGRVGDTTIEPANAADGWIARRIA